MRERVKELKETEKEAETMCRVFEEVAEKAKAEGLREGERKGLREGKREGLLETARHMIESGLLAMDDIAKLSGLPLSQIKKLKASMA